MITVTFKPSSLFQICMGAAFVRWYRQQFNVRVSAQFIYKNFYGVDSLPKRYLDVLRDEEIALSIQGTGRDTQPQDIVRLRVKRGPKRWIDRRTIEYRVDDGLGSYRWDPFSSVVGIRAERSNLGMPNQKFLGDLLRISSLYALEATIRPKYFSILDRHKLGMVANENCRTAFLEIMQKLKSKRKNGCQLEDEDRVHIVLAPPSQERYREFQYEAHKIIQSKSSSGSVVAVSHPSDRGKLSFDNAFSSEALGYDGIVEELFNDLHDSIVSVSGCNSTALLTARFFFNLPVERYGHKHPDPFCERLLRKAAKS